MALYQQMLGMLNADAKNQDIRANAAERVMGILATQQEMRLKQQAMDLNNAYRVALNANEQMGDPMQNDPLARSIAETNEQNVTPEQKQFEEMSGLKNRLMTNIRLAERFGQNPQVYYTALNSVDTNLRQLSQDMTKKQGEQAQKVAQILRDVNSPEKLVAGLDYIESNYGKQARAKVEKSLPHDENGNVLWNETTRNRLAAPVSEYTTMAQKAQQDHNAITSAIQGANLQERARHDRIEENLRNQEIALRRESGRRAEEKMSLLGIKDMGKVTDADQKMISKFWSDYKIADYQKARDVADETIAKLQDPKRGYEEVTPEKARELIAQGNQMMQNFRARVGGKYQESEVNRMNSMLGKMEKWKDTIFEGDKILAKQEMLQFAQMMKDTYNNRNVQMLKSELSVAQKTNQKGGNAANLVLRGSIDDAEQSGMAKKVSIGGKDYVVFGPKPEDKFPVPEMSPKIRSLMNAEPQE